jgi:Fe-S cluster biogenesis protein NfuA
MASGARSAGTRGVAVNVQAVEAALDLLRPGLRSDGLDLRLGALDGDIVQVVLEARPGACLDCVVPEPMMIQILETAIREREASLEHVELVKRGF